MRRAANARTTGVRSKDASVIINNHLELSSYPTLRISTHIGTCRGKLNAPPCVMSNDR
jgi:hypothetical protein